MNTEASHSSPHYSSLSYFKNALQLFDDAQIPDALQSLDAAIIFSNNSPFYIHQKIRILFHLGALKSCSEFIIGQIEYLYKYSSLYMFCRTLDYLQIINQYTVGQLKTILHQNHIPYCIATYYKEWLTAKEKPFLELAEAALNNDDYALCIDFCSLMIKYKQTRAPKMLYMMAYSYHMLNELDKANAMYTEYAKLAADRSQVSIDLILIAMELGNYDIAILSLKDLLEQDPLNKTYLTYLGECYCQSGKVSTAIRTFQSIAKMYPDDVQNLFNLSHAYSRLKKNWRSKRCRKAAEKQFQRNSNP